MQILQALWYNDHCARRLIPPNGDAFVRLLFSLGIHVRSALASSSCYAPPIELIESRLLAQLTRFDVTGHNDHATSTRLQIDL